MNDVLDKRSSALIKALSSTLWPAARALFQLKTEGLENIPSKGPFLFISNHNIGAFIEGHASLFILQEKLGSNFFIYGLAHPVMFKIPIIKQYHEKIGAVPATNDMADKIFKNGHSLMIFPGGNRQALRPIWDYKNNHFRQNHGWAKIAFKHNITVIPISFKGSHFVNPVLLSGEWISKLLVLPWILGLKSISLSVGQILSAFSVFYFFKLINTPILINIAITYLAFVLTLFLIVFPYPIKMKVYPPLIPGSFKNRECLEEAMGIIMDNIYES